jgi:ketosteroid isomerase-like protein
MRRTGFLMACLYATAWCAPAQDDANPSVRSKIIALEKAWNQAYKLGDTRALDALLDNEIVLVTDDGSAQTKGEFLTSVKADKSQEQQVAPESMSVHMFGTTAIATGVFRAKGVEGGKPYVRRERFVDTWVYKGEKWVCVASDATPVLH